MNILVICKNKDSAMEDFIKTVDRQNIENVCSNFLTGIVKLKGDRTIKFITNLNNIRGIRADILYIDLNLNNLDLIKLNRMNLISEKLFFIDLERNHISDDVKQCWNIDIVNPKLQKKRIAIKVVGELVELIKLTKKFFVQLFLTDDKEIKTLTRVTSDNNVMIVTVVSEAIQEIKVKLCFTKETDNK